jgi:LacI family transcriptional regulator, repressor for deo operon, udp, cdd, tsx, nupC, and nupG
MTAVSMVTIHDVALRAGVSIATVSRAVRGRPGVSSETRERVLEISRQLGYPTAGRSGAGMRGRRVAVVLPRVDTWFFGHVLNAVCAAVTDAGGAVDLHVLPEPSRRAPVLASIGNGGRVVGALLVGIGLSEAERRALCSQAVQVVGLHSDVAPLPNVASDDAGMARSAVEHLLALGHRRIAMICSEPGKPVPHAVREQRAAGYRAAMEAAAAPVPDDLVLCGADSIEGGQLAMSRILSQRHLPTAVFTQTDEMAFGALAALRGSGLAVPGDVSVVSIDDHPLATALGLTTVAHDVAEQARHAVDLLRNAVDVVRYGHADTPRPTTTGPGQLIVRRTTSPPHIVGQPMIGRAVSVGSATSA